MKVSNLGLKITVTAMVAISLMGCGASKSGSGAVSSGEYASRNHPGQNSDDEDSQSVVFAECNAIAANTSNIEGRLTGYYHPVSGEYYPSMIRFKIDRLPTDITTGSSVYIQMFRWYADPAGKKMFNSTPVGFYVMNRTTKKYVNSAALKTISKATIQNLITNNNLGSTVTLNNFFEKHLLILEGMDLTYDALSLVIYDSNKGTQAQVTHDVLIPAFAANPNVYAASHTASILKELHPFWADRDAGLSDDHFRSVSMESCIP